MNYLVKNKYLEILISSIGAELVSVKYLNKERLWQNDNNTWERHAPILFPHAGKCSVVVNNKHYPDQFHGFLRDQEFTLFDKENESITLSLKDNAKSHETYPFAFEFLVTYRLIDNTIEITYKVINPSQEDIYFFIGCHESYSLNNTVDNYEITFNLDEDLHSIDMNMNQVYVGKGKVDLNSNLLNDGGTIIIKNIQSKEATLKDKNGNLIAKTVYKDFPNLLLWHSVGSKMICIEPWINLPDRQIDEEKEFKDKDNIVKCAPKESKSFVRTITYFDNK